MDLEAAAPHRLRPVVGDQQVFDVVEEVGLAVGEEAVGDVQPEALAFQRPRAAAGAR